MTGSVDEVSGLECAVSGTGRLPAIPERNDVLNVIVRLAAEND